MNLSPLELLRLVKSTQNEIDMYFRDLLIQYWHNYVDIWEKTKQPLISSVGNFDILKCDDIAYCENFRLDSDSNDPILEFEHSGETFYLELENVINPDNMRQQKIARDLKAQLEKEEAEKANKTHRYEQYLKLKAEFENQKGEECHK